MENNYSHVKKKNFWIKNDLELLNIIQLKLNKIYESDPIPKLVHFIWLGKK